jgi:hypothetical protein
LHIFSNAFTNKKGANFNEFAPTLLFSFINYFISLYFLFATTNIPATNTTDPNTIMNTGVAPV